MLKHLTVIITVTLLCLVACVPGHNDYSEFANIPSTGWPYRQSLEFTPQIADSISQGRLTIAIRHSNSYPFSNIWIELRSFAPDSTLERTDTINIRMADIYGRWFGHGLGASYQVTDTLPDPVTLHRGGYLQLRHVMRPDTLPAIEQVGILYTADR